MKINLSFLLKAVALGVAIYLIFRVYSGIKAGLAFTSAIGAALTTSPLKQISNVASAASDTASAVGGAAESYVGVAESEVAAGWSAFKNWLANI